MAVAGTKHRAHRMSAFWRLTRSLLIRCMSQSGPSRRVL